MNQPLSSDKMIMSIKYQVDSSILSDVCLFSSFSFSGKVEEYVYYYLSELQKAGLSIVFISTSPLAEACVKRLSEYASIIIERENKCPDFGSWKAGLSILNWGEKLNSVLLVNDSVFGPFIDLGNIISAMKTKFDVWGMTDSYEVEYHLQSYFLYFNKAAIKSRIFAQFWENVDLSASKEEVIYKYEIGLSILFRKNNFSLGAYASIDVLNKSADHGHTVINPTLVYWKSLIKAHQFPFLKRELIIKKKISRTYYNVGLYVNVGNWKRTIEENSSYPVKYILDFINNYYETIKLTNSNIILRKRKLLFLINNAEIGDEQRIVINFLQWLKKETSFDVEIIICKESDDDLTLEFSRFGIVKNFYSLSGSEKINLKERLIDEVALIFSNTLENLDIQKFFSFLDVPQIVFVHNLTSAINDILLMDNNIKWIRNNVSDFIVSSNFTKRNIIKCLGIDDKKVQLVYKFVNHYSIEEFEKECLKIKSDLGIPSDAFIVGMYGKFHWKDSADLLPVIAAALCQNNDNIHIIWLGADIHSPLYQSVQFDLTRARLDERVHLVGKQINTRPFLAIFDVFLMYSREDSFPLVNLESGLAGKPVIHFQNSDDCLEYTNLGIGHPILYLDIASMTEKVLDYYNNRSRLEIEKESISKIVKDNFATDVQAPKILQIINTYYDHEELAFAEDPLITFMTHIYYENSWEEIRNKLKNFDNGRNYFLFSISEACLLKEEVIKNIKESFKNAFFLITTNIGKDIGGKMALIDLYLLLDIKSTYIVFLHDKQSHHSIHGEFWKNELFKIIDDDNQNLILDLFKDPKTGLVGSKEHIVNEYDKSTGTFRNNNQLSKNLLMQFGISIDNYDFLGGSIYWLRSSIIEKFFARNHPILMRENLEAGNVLDLHEERLAHTWERMFSWIAVNEGYTIKGI